MALLLAVLSFPDRAWAADTSPPTGTVVINGGAAATNSRTVTLTLSATDALSAGDSDALLQYGKLVLDGRGVRATKTWTAVVRAGTKTVYVQFKDAAGNWSSLPITDTIVLDTTAPTISSRTATSITSSASTITWTTNEPATVAGRLRGHHQLWVNHAARSRARPPTVFRSAASSRTRRTTTAFARAMRPATNASAPTARSRPPSSIQCRRPCSR